MRRRLFNLAAAVSLVLCVATTTLWITSFFVGMDGLRGRSLFLTLLRGEFNLEMQHAACK